MAEMMVGVKVLRKRFQLSSLSAEEKQRLAGYIKQLGATYLDRQDFTKQVTHVVCGQPNRSEKYLAGCVSGRWVLKKEFIEDSFEHGKWLCEEDYEWGSEVLPSHSPLVPLYDAPKKWRMTLKSTNEGAFKDWIAIVLVQDNKMKKAYERLLEAGSATISKKKAPFEDRNLNNEVTHVFVEEDLRSEVQCFESNGIPCITPDYIPEYIIQAAKEHTLNHFIVKDNWKKTSKKSKKSTRGILPGKENELHGSVMPTMNNPAGKKGTKRQSPDCELCAAKRQKTQSELFPHHYSYMITDKVKNGRNRSLAYYPTYISSIVESCVDEGYIFLALDSISSSLSKRHVPSSRCLHMIMNQFLLNSPSKNQAMQSYHTLNQILSLHPSASCQNLYVKGLEEPSINQNTDIQEYLSPWQFVSKVIRHSLGVSKEGETNRIQENADLLLKFFDNLFKQDAASTTQPDQKPILLQILWLHDLNKTKDTIKEFVKMCCKSVARAIYDSSKSTVCQVLLDTLSLAIILKKREDISGEDCEFFVQQLFLVLSKTASSEATKLLLEKCHSSWLKTRIAELILGNFNKCLILEIHRPLLDKTLSLDKIVSCYFFLLPKTIDSVQSDETMKTRYNATTVRKNILSSFEDNNLDDYTTGKLSKISYRKNAKGETSLHMASILNDATKVEDILNQDIHDVNATDNAGWTALHEACNFGHLECVKKILEYHERTNKVNLLASPIDGTTVLHDAVVNNHLAVVKLLLKAGGTKLLEAKTSAGKTALDLAVTREMTDFLKRETNRIKQNHILESMQPLSEDYDKCLSNRESGKKRVAMKECEEYLFLVAQLLQGYVKEHISTFTEFGNDKKPCSNCTLDFQCWQKLPEHLDNIEMHVKRITGSPQQLSTICQLYITSMRLCIA